MSSEREFDLVIFGATGFTGFFVVRELCLSIAEKPDEYSNLKWAVAGRNDKKLSEVLAKVGAELSKDLSSVVKIEADVTDAKSLAAMASRTKLVINCVGPYRFYGRQVVEACLNEGTHHIDISGEPQYIESIQVEFNAKAKEKDILVVSTCGWDSIPCDLGVDFLKRKFDGKLHHVETFMATRPGPEVTLYLI
ncbi:PREDICTED: saccharopine dehydrogenase-like oxidoreductase [Rhagoletis zephyria]|uniref:saccharopine dehydrogenase-like oxidoreductase n=1 Tax=Rhagoletis zephyria TaxID=28612 RepID=UPI0008119CA9|nr:PREDICTED: saccharopine dehydrogenase-like oxidoreductase [Rhagoletis zephyria]